MSLKKFDLSLPSLTFTYGPKFGNIETLYRYTGGWVVNSLGVVQPTARSAIQNSLTFWKTRFPSESRSAGFN